MASTSSLRILFGGDVVVDHPNYVITDAVANLCRQVNTVVLNLEAPVVPPQHTQLPYPKVGLNLFQTSTAVLPILKRLQCQVTSGANNHMMDYGIEGIQSTRMILEQNSIQIGGCGDTLQQAQVPLALGDGSWMLLCVCEEEFGSADHTRGGCYSMYSDAVIEHMQTLIQSGKHVIVYAHGGGEMIPIPSQYILQRYRQFVDAGAAAVVGHHPHVVQGIEHYRGKVIVYSVGNLIHHVYPRSWGMLVECNLQDGQMTDCRPHFIRLQDQTLDLITDDVKQRNYLTRVSELLDDASACTVLQQEQAMQMYQSYYQSYFRGLFLEPAPLPRWKQWLGHTSPVPPDVTRQERLLLHLIRNASHKFFIETALKLRTGEVTDQRTTVSHRLLQQLQDEQR